MKYEMSHNSPRLTVAVVSHDVFWPVRGGGGVRVYWITRMLKERGHDVFVIAPFLCRKGLCTDFPNIRIRPIGRISRFSRFKEILYIVLMVRMFLRLLASRVDVIYAQNVVAGFPAIFAGRFLRIPVVFDMIDLLTGYSRNALVYRFGPRLEQWVMKRADAVVVTSRNLKALGEGCGAKRLEQVRHGVNLDIFNPRSQERKFIVFSGGMETNDGVLLIPDAAKIVLKSFPDIRFLFVGEGKAQPSLIRKVQNLGLSDNFEFRGWVDQKEVPHILASARIGLITSLNVSGMVYAYPLRSIEYMAMGIPFVASDLEGIREQAEGSGGGLLFQAGSAEDLAKSILRLLRDSSLCERFGRNGRKWAVRHADWQKNAVRVAEICEAMVGGKTSPHKLTADTRRS